MDRALSSKRVSELIGLVYDCVIEPGRWQGTVHRLREELGFATCALSLHALPSGDPLLFISSGIEPDWLAKLLTLGESIVQIWGGAARIHELPLAEPIQLSHAVDPRSFAGNPFYDEWARPLGLTDDVGIHLMSDATAISSMGLGWHGARGELCEKQLAPLRLLAPHLRRAVTISRLMDLQLLAASTFARALDTLALGEAQAQSLGIDVRRTRLLILFGVALGVGAATAVSGVIGFVGLVAPHLVRPLTGYQPGRALLPAALVGAILVTVADVATRMIQIGPEIKLGVFISMIGAPFFLWLVLHLRKTAP